MQGPSWQLVCFVAFSCAASAAGDAPALTGSAAFGDWKSDRPGVRRHINVEDLPPPYATKSASRSSVVVAPPVGVKPQVPLGFEISVFASGLSGPRLLRTAPNGDVFVAEMQANQVRVLRASRDDAPAETIEVFADRLSGPFGINFYPIGPDPQWVYVANSDSVVRFAYRSGDLKHRAAAETVVAKLPSGGHATRDLVFSPDGSRMFVSVGSESNASPGRPRKSEMQATAWDKENGVTGAGWGDEELRAAVLSFTPDGKDRRIFATGIRNCVGLAIQPRSGELWCSTNERDGLGDDLVPDYITRVKEGAFFGWPWYYMGDHEDPRLKGQRPDLKGRVTVPDVLLQPHSASLQMTFYDGHSFPEDYRGDAFAAEHGSWNRSLRTGYKVIRVIMKDGVPTGEYEGFMTGLVLNDSDVWGRPVGVNMAGNGDLLVSEDGNGTIWRIRYVGRQKKHDKPL